LYLNPSTGVFSYIPLYGQNMSTVTVEPPVLQSLVNVGGTYDAPAHNVSLSGITSSLAMYHYPSPGFCSFDAAYSLIWYGRG
jgi:hypothetical protein